MNGTMLQSFEWHISSKGKFWKQVAANAPKLKRLGITAVWLPPACKGNSGIHDVGYGLYDLYDLGEFDQKGTIRTKYGTKEEYITCVKKLQENGIQVLADIVLGQRIGADEAEILELKPVWKDNRKQSAGDRFTAKVMTRFTFPGRNGKWSDFIWDSASLNAVDYYEGCGHDYSKVYLLPNKHFAEDVDKEYGNFDYLMGSDMDSDAPHVRAELKRWGAWYLSQTGVDGFRLDAVKHISASFYREWLKDLRLFTGKELFAVGEYWHGDINVLMKYLEAQNYEMSLFDVPLHMHFHEASVAGGAYDLRRLYDGTISYARPTQAVTFVDNHDTQPGQSLQSWVEPWFKPVAYALILLRSVGYPCVFYGDLYGISQPKISGTKLLPKLMRMRTDLAYGEEHTYFDETHCIGFTREGEETRERSGIAVLCSNRDRCEKRMYVGEQHAGETWRCVVGGSASVVVDSHGTALFKSAKQPLTIWIPVKKHGTWLRKLFSFRHKMK